MITLFIVEHTSTMTGNNNEIILFISAFGFKGDEILNYHNIWNTYNDIIYDYKNRMLQCGVKT